MARLIVLAGGGTGGHVFPALALAEIVRSAPDTSVRFIGTARGIGMRHALAAGHEVDVVPSEPVVGRNPIAMLRALALTAHGVWIARRLLRERGAQLVIGVGGYASVPAVVAALTLRIPTALLEADAAPGLANRTLGRFASRVFVQFQDARAHFPEGRALLTGFPVRPIPPHEESVNGRVRVLVIGGSQGARSVNRALCGSLDALSSVNIEITHQTGAADYEEVVRAYADGGLDACVAPFFDDLPERLARADLVVGRAGSSTAEFCLAGLAQILVPYPHAAGGHQMRNARELERSGAAIVIPDARVAEDLGRELCALVRDDERRARMAEAARERAAPDAARRIWEACGPLLEERP